MTHESSLDRDWGEIVARLGGEDSLTASARQTRAMVRPRRDGVRTAVDLLRLMLAYCLGSKGLRLTAGWAAAQGIVDISNVALLKRLRSSADWLAWLIGEMLAKSVPEVGRGRLIRLVDATTVRQAGKEAKTSNRLWRIHSAFDLPAERFGYFELTDQQEGEALDRIPVIPGEIRIADAAYLQADRIGAVQAAGADILVRANWKNARWLDADGNRVDMIDLLGSPAETIDQPIRVARSGNQPPLALRLVAVRKPPQVAAEARRKARLNARRRQHQISQATLIAADWVLLITSLQPDDFPTAEVLALYRLRWRIELAFKRLKSQIGLKPPPGTDPRSARAWVLAHLLMILLLEPLCDGFEDSPHWAAA